jgi:hypothetical protein
MPLDLTLIFWEQFARADKNGLWSALQRSEQWNCERGAGSRGKRLRTRRRPKTIAEPIRPKAIYTTKFEGEKRRLTFLKCSLGDRIEATDDWRQRQRGTVPDLRLIEITTPWFSADDDDNQRERTLSNNAALPNKQRIPNLNSTKQKK